MKLLACSIGNTSVRFALFQGERIVKRWRFSTPIPPGAPGRAIRLPRVLVDRAVFCSVAPGLTSKIGRVISRATGLDPVELSANAPHALKIEYRQPEKLGSDRVAAALGARALYPSTNLIVIDCGTATTVTAISKKGAVLGGSILPGVGLWPKILAGHTAQLPEVCPKRPARVLGRSPEEAIESGAFYGHAFAVKGLVSRTKAEAFGRANCRVLVTGGGAGSLAGVGIDYEMVADLVLRGLAAYSCHDGDHDGKHRGRA